MARRFDDVLSALPRFAWRGEFYPVTERSVTFRHETVEHTIQYRGGDFPEPIGPHGLLFTYTLSMRNGIYKSPYEKLFERKILTLIKALRDRSAGPLVDPVYGHVQCVPISYSDDMDVQRRDGTDVRVEFLEAPDMGAETDQFSGGVQSVTAIVSQATDLDAEIELADWEQEPSPEPSTEILAALSSPFAQVAAQRQRTAAKLADLSFRMRKVERAADAAGNPDNWRLRDTARTIRDSSIAQAVRAAEPPGKKIGRVTVPSRTTVSAVAAANGMSVVELLALNPALARSPVVSQGTVVTVQNG